MPMQGAGELGGGAAVIAVTLGSGRQGKIPVVAIADPTGALQPGMCGASGAAPVSGSLTTNGASSVFTPVPGRPVSVRLAGVFGGATVATEVSYDDGATWSPVTITGAAYGVFTGPAAEPVAEAGDVSTRYRLIVSGASGTTNIAYRIGH